MMRLFYNLPRPSLHLLALLSLICWVDPGCGPGLTPPRAQSTGSGNAGSAANTDMAGTKSGAGGAGATIATGGTAGTLGASAGHAGNAGAGGSKSDTDAGTDDDAGVP